MQLTKTTFSFDGGHVGVQLDDQGEPWFRAADVCPHLGLDDTRQAVERLSSDQISKRIRPAGIQHRPGLAPPPPVSEWWVNEPGLYSLVLRSRKPEAERFKRWVTDDVLPSIRKTGGYGTALDMRDHRQLAAAALQLIEINQEYLAQLEAAKPKVDGYEKLIDADGLRGLQQTGKALGLRPNKFIQLLIENGYLFRREGTLVPYQRHLDGGLFVVKNLVVEKTARLQTHVTQKGFDHFWRRFGTAQLSLN